MPCLCLFLLAISQAGCLVAAVGAAAGAGAAYGYYQGNSIAAYPAEFAVTFQSVKQALTDLAMPIRHEHFQGLTGEIESSIEDGTRVTISLEEKPRMQASDGHQTDVTIRVGLFGDSKLSNKIQQQIHQHVIQRQAQLGSPNRLPPISGNQSVQPPQAVSPPPPTNVPSWKPASQSGTGTLPP